jgi:hypothetical protein
MIHSRYPQPCKVSSNIPDFISDYFTQSYHSSPILLIRADIRQNHTLNALIHDNRHFLSSLFKGHRKLEGITLEAIESLFLKKFEE